MTKTEAISLHKFQPIYHKMHTNPDSTPIQAFCVCPAEQFTNSNFWKVRMLIGLKRYFYLTQTNMDQWSLEENKNV